jgi:CheY-like chemotaxis protein
MPGMDGFELCSKIHETVLNQATPVVFVTSLRDFDSRAKSIVCGGRDLISKPFLTFELTVKTLTLATRERLKGRSSAGAGGIESVKSEGLSSMLPAVISKPLLKGAVVENAAGPSTAPETNPAGMPPPGPARLFIAQARTQAGALLELVELIQQTADETAQKEMMTDLYLRVHSLAAGAEACRQHSLSQIACALEGHLKKLLNQTGSPGTSTLQTVAGTLGLIQELCEREPEQGRATAAPIRVLAVDDDPIARRFMTNALQLKFLQPQSAADGMTAVELATRQPFDVIFLDVQMPDMDGFAVCKQIRETTANRRTPVVFVTSQDDPAMKERAQQCGGSDYISKPYICSELTLKTITFAFRNRLSNPDYTSGEEIPSPDRA